MALNTSKCNHSMPLPFKGLIATAVGSDTDRSDPPQRARGRGACWLSVLKLAAGTCQADRYWTNVTDVTATTNQLVPAHRLYHPRSQHSALAKINRAWHCRNLEMFMQWRRETKQIGGRSGNGPNSKNIGRVRISVDPTRPIHVILIPVVTRPVIKFSMSLFFYLFTFEINLWHRKFVTADVTAMFVNNQYSVTRTRFW